MRIGKLWEYLLIEFGRFEREGEYGLDIVSKRRRKVVELKNRYNTDNKASRDKNYEKLIQFHDDNPSYELIYGVINDITLEGKNQYKLHHGVGIHYLSGKQLFHHLLGRNRYEQILPILLEKIDSIYQP